MKEDLGMQRRTIAMVKLVEAAENASNLELLKDLEVTFDAPDEVPAVYR